MSRKKQEAIIIGLFIVFISLYGFPQVTTPQGYRIEPLVLDSGGGAAAIADYSMIASIGQTAVGTVADSRQNKIDVGFLQRTNYVSYDFEFSPLGWQYGDLAPKYDPLGHSWSAGRLNLVVNSTNAFGFWESRFEVPLLPKLFLMTVQLSSDQTDGSKVYPTRYRFGTEDSAQIGGGVLESTTGYDAPNPAGRNYKFFFRSPKQYFPAGINSQYAFDVYNIGHETTLGKRISLEHLNIDAIDERRLGPPLNSVTFTFDDSTERWQTKKPSPDFAYNIPFYFYQDGALQIEAIDATHNEVGYWYRTNAIKVSPNKLYRLTALCRTNQRNPGATPDLSLRALTGDQHLQAFTEIRTRLNSKTGLSARVNKPYQLFIVSPSYYTGGLTVQFELRNLNTSIAVGSRLILDSCRIDEFNIPSP